MKALLVLLVLGSAQGRLTCPTYEELATPEASHLDPFKYQVRWLFQGDVPCSCRDTSLSLLLPTPSVLQRGTLLPLPLPISQPSSHRLDPAVPPPFPPLPWLGASASPLRSSPHRQSSVDPHLTSAHHTPPHPAGLLVRGIQPQRVPGGRLPLHAVRSSGRGMCCVESDRCAGP